MIDKLKCKKCGHEWYGRIVINGVMVAPKQCPKCKRTDWEKERKKNDDEN